MNLKARVGRLERTVRSLRPLVLFLFDAGMDRIRSNLHPGSMTDDEALDLLDDPPAPVTFAVMQTEPDPYDPYRGATPEDLYRENDGAPYVPPGGPVGPPPPPEPDYDLDRAREIVLEALDRAASGRSMEGLDLSGLYPDEPEG